MTASERRHRIILFICLALAALPLYTKVVPCAIAQDAAVPQNANASTTPPPLPSYGFNIAGKQHQVYFTIDDHPNNNTNKYLDILKDNNLKATFFVVASGLYSYRRSPQYGPAVRQLASMKRMVLEGHVLGNHSVSHALMCTKLTPAQVRWEVDKTQEWVNDLLGVTLRYWRPPHGHLCPLVQNAVAKHKLKTVMWDVDDFRSTPQSMFRVVTQRATRGEVETITLFHHDVSKFSSFIKLLKASGQKTIVRN